MDIDHLQITIDSFYLYLFKSISKNEKCSIIYVCNSVTQKATGETFRKARRDSYSILVAHRNSSVFKREGSTKTKSFRERAKTYIYVNSLSNRRKKALLNPMNF